MYYVEFISPPIIPDITGIGACSQTDVRIFSQTAPSGFGTPVPQTLLYILPISPLTITPYF